jgi:D-beta-D-heptose 7-phosphate kinase / D-beta-D-heptose 1-phosphate adenosyltransferase
MQAHLIDVVRRSFRPESNIRPTVLVVGDLMLDRYLWGTVERISPEAPVPVIHLTDETERLGGAANVAANLAGLGVDTLIAGRIGVDPDGIRLQILLHDAGIDTAGLVEDSSSSTICKTRVIGGHQQMIRLDREQRTQPSVEAERLFHEHVSALIETRRPAALVLSDYAKGVLTTRVCQVLIDTARHHGMPVLVDPKGRDYSKYRGVTTLTPNLRELSDVCGVPADDISALLAAGAVLTRELALDFLAFTRGEAGISLLVPGKEPAHLPATARQVFDVSGAGDTVIATLAAGLVAGLAPVEALELANVAAGSVVAKIGTVPVSREELLIELEHHEGVEQADKIRNLEGLLRQIAIWRQGGAHIVFTNGCFDLLHAGHVTYLEQARLLGDRLILGLNTDRSVRALKGPNRPIIHEADRARVLAALESVDAVILFDDETPLELIRAVHPDVLVKGDDYRDDQVVGGTEVKAWGGRVVLVPVVPGRSSSYIIDKLGT